MEVKVLKTTETLVALVFVPRTREDLQMAVDIFVSVIANHFCIDLIDLGVDEPTPEDEERMYASKEVQFIFNRETKELRSLIIVDN